MGFLLDKCKLKKMDDEILSTCHPFTCGDESYLIVVVVNCLMIFLERNECVGILLYYQKNEFLFLFSTEQQEAENLGYDMTKSLHTRLMYYDLKKLTSN